MPKLNPNEAPEGFIAVRCKETNPNCDGCVRFPNEFGICNEKCSPALRKDKCWVIFKRKPTKPTKPTKPAKPASKPREWMAWAFQTKAPLDVVDLPYICEKRKFARKYNAELGGTGVIRVKITEVL